MSIKNRKNPEVTTELVQQEKLCNMRTHFLTLPVGNLKSDGYDIIWKQSQIDAAVVFLGKKDSFKTFEMIHSHMQQNMPEVLQKNLTLIGYKSLSDYFYRNVKEKLKTSLQGIITVWSSETLVGYNFSLLKHMEGRLWNFVLQNWEPQESLNVTSSYYHAYTLTWARSVFEFLTELYYLLDMDRLQILPKHTDTMLHLNSFKFVYYLTCCTSASHCNSTKICFHYTTNDFFKTQYCFVCGCKSIEHRYILFPKRGGEMKNFVRFFKAITDSSITDTIRNEKKEIVRCLATLTKLCNEMNWFVNDPNLDILEKLTEKHPLQSELAKLYNNELGFNCQDQDSKFKVLKILDMLPKMKLGGWYVDEVALGMFRVWLEKSHYMFYGIENSNFNRNLLKVEGATCKNTDGLHAVNLCNNDCKDKKNYTVNMFNEVKNIADRMNKLEDAIVDVKESVVQINNNIIKWSKH